MADAILDSKKQVSGPKLTEARVAECVWRGRLRKLEFDERSGKLVNADAVRVAAFAEGRVLRDRVLNLSDRLAAVLAAEADPAQVHAILTKELRKALLAHADGAAADGKDTQ